MKPHLYYIFIEYLIRKIYDCIKSSRRGYMKMKLKRLFLTPFALMLVAIGFSSVSPMCLAWYYKPEVPEDLK